MQYILTQSEYDSLTPVKGLQERNEALDEASEYILKKNNFVCIHDRKRGVSSRADLGYCDLCPIYKDFDKSTSKHLCIKHRNYSK